MRIGVMLRTMRERQGIGVYTQNVMDELLAADSRNEYVLFYRDPDLVGRYAGRPNVEEHMVKAGSKAVWDQVRIPLMAARTGVDVVFHTKFTVPLLARCRTAMVAHGASWFVHPELYPRLDLAYIRTMMPLYCRKASAILANSDLTRDDYIRILRVPPKKIHTVRLGVGSNFSVVADPEELSRVIEKYGLPERFIVSVVKYDPRKNFRNLIAAFRVLRARVSAKLVVIGIGCDKYRDEFELDRDGTSDDVVFTGWVDQADLPAIYSVARCLFFPSVYEEFGIPTCEAMACGCPPIVSKTGNLPELAGDAGLIVDPFDPDEMADALERVWTDEETWRKLSDKSRVRAREFTWARCARQTLSVLEALQ